LDKTRGISSLQFQVVPGFDAQIFIILLREKATEQLPERQPHPFSLVVSIIIPIDSLLSVIADALCRRHALLSAMSTEVVGFEKIKDNYESCPDFENIYSLKR